MKTIKYIIGLITMLVLSSCSNNVEHEFFSGDDSKMSFVSSKFVTELVKTDLMVSVPINRGNKGAEQNVIITGEFSQPDIVQFKSAKGQVGVTTETVTFAAGESIAYIDLVFGKVEDLGVTDNYQVKLSFDSIEHAAPWSVYETQVSFKRQLTYKDIGQGHFKSDFIDVDHDVNVQRAEEAPVISLLDCYVKGTPIVFEMSDDLSEITSFSTQETGHMHATYGMVSVEYVSSTIVGKEIEVVLKFLVSAGSFGTRTEVITLP